MTCGCASFGADMTWHDRVLDLMAGGLDQMSATRAVVCPEAFPAVPLRRESGQVSDALVAWAVCTFGLLFVIGVAVVGR